MALTLYFHPLSSFCQKALIALYENGTPFTPQKVDLMDEKESAAFKQLWPVGKFPVLRDEKNGKTIPESTSIIEYLAQHYPGSVQPVPATPSGRSPCARRTVLRSTIVHLDPWSSPTGCGQPGRMTQSASRTPGPPADGPGASTRKR